MLQKKTMPVMMPMSINTNESRMNKTGYFGWKSKFKAIWSWLTSRRRWVLMEPWTVMIQGILYEIPAGFITDGASVPRFLWWLFKPTGILLLPAIVHDYGYENRHLIEKQTGCKVFKNYTRRGWDQVFYHLVTKIAGSPMIALLPYLGVRLGGWIGWNRRRKSD